MPEPVVGRASPFKARGPFRGIRAPFRGVGVFGRYPARTNSIRNSTMAGAVAGTPGTVPTNWAATTLNGITRELVGTGIENGLPYIDFRLSGTAGTAYSFTNWVSFELNNVVAASIGQTWTASCSYKLAGGSTTGVVFRVRVGEVSGTSNYNAITLTSTLTRFFVTRTFTGAGTAYAQPSTTVDIANGATIDVTIRMAAPQLELGATASAYISTTSAAASRVADVLAGAY